MDKYYIEIERYGTDEHIEITLSVGDMEETGTVSGVETTHWNLNNSDTLTTIIKQVQYLLNTYDIHAIVEMVYDMDNNLIKESKALLK